MKFFSQVIAVAPIALLLSLPMLAQTQVQPPPRPADSGPTLATTMQFIQDKLNGLGRINFVEFIQNSSNGTTNTQNFSFEYSNFTADKNLCTFTYHLKIFKNGKQSYDGDQSLALQTVQDIVVKDYAQDVTETFAITGTPNLIATSINPPLTVLLARKASGPRGEFEFMDAGLADRVAKAMTHAVELCGGGNKEPF